MNFVFLRGCKPGCRKGLQGDAFRFVWSRRAAPASRILTFTPVRGRHAPMNTYHDGSGTLPGASAPYEAFGVHAPRRGTGYCWWAAIGLLGALQLLTLWQVLALTTNFHADVIALASTKRSEMTTTLSQDIRGTTLERPKKLLLGGLTPTADQMMRGDCWLFSVMGVLEDSYRRFGVEHGWLDPNVYLRLSRQAFGIMVMKTCQRHPERAVPSQG